METFKTTLEQVKKKVNHFFRPDIRFTYNKKDRVYIMIPVSSLGLQYMRETYLYTVHSSIRVETVKLNSVLRLIGFYKETLCYEIIG